MDIAYHEKEIKSSHFNSLTAALDSHIIILELILNNRLPCRDRWGVNTDRKGGNMRRIGCILLSLILIFNSFPVTVFAKPEWPKDTGVESESGIVMDIDSGAVIFAQDIHTLRIPASITKLLTALIVIENTDNLEEKVTCSRNAVYNVESGSGNKFGLDEGDSMTVREALEVMILQSSNQAANALAEHVAGSQSAFVDMMNEKLEAIGCVDGSKFANPSGLNDDNQRVSAYDMALIARAVFQNPLALEICSTNRASIPATANNPEGVTFSIEHQLVKNNENPDSEYYFPWAKAGKTGWTSQAGQTLVTYAEKDGRRLVAVTLKSTEKTHYSDTMTILDFSFTKFKNENVGENEVDYVTGEDPVQIGEEIYDPSELKFDESGVITLPNDAQFTEAEKSLETQLPKEHPQGAVARINYSYNEREIGYAWLLSTRKNTVDTVATPGESSEGNGSGQGGIGKSLGSLFGRFKMQGSGNGIILTGVFISLGILAAGGVIVVKKRREAEREREQQLRQKRRQRLADIGFTEEEFERIVEERRRQRDEEL